MAGIAHRSDNIVSMPFAGSEDVAGRAEPNGMAEKNAHGSSRRVDRRLAQAVRGKPGAMHAGDGAGKIGDRRDQRGPGLGRRMLVRAIVAPQMKPQRARVMNCAATIKVRHSVN